MMTCRINDSLEHMKVRKPNTRGPNTKIEQEQKDPEPVSKPSLMFQKFLYQNLNSKYIKDKFVPDYSEANKFCQSLGQYLSAQQETNKAVEVNLMSPREDIGVLSRFGSTPRVQQHNFESRKIASNNEQLEKKGDSIVHLGMEPMQEKKK